MNAEQEVLIRKAQQSLQAARLLADGEFHDFAVARAYYTMLYATPALLLAKGLSFSKHSAVIAAFGQHFAKPGLVPLEFHRHLIEAHDSRNVGDYDTGQGFGEADANNQIDRAEKFLAMIRSQLESSEPPE